MLAKMVATTRPTKQQMISFGSAVRKRREHLAIPRATFASAVGLSYKHIFNIESGEAWPSFLPYIAICRALGVKRIPLVGAGK